MTLNAAVVVPGIFCAALWLRAMLNAAAQVSRGQERITCTLHRTTCDKCNRVWELESKAYDPDLGATFDRVETCLACLYHSGRVVELKMEELTPEKIRSAFNTEEETTCRTFAQS